MFNVVLCCMFNVVSLLCDRFVCHCTVIAQIYDHNCYKSNDSLFYPVYPVFLIVIVTENTHHISHAVIIDPIPFPLNQWRTLFVFKQEQSH